jgi:N-acetylmuramic acid 6-phosphate etherase
LKRRAATRTLQNLRTEKTNPASSNLDQKSALEIARIINAEDAKVAGAVKHALPQIAQAIEAIAAALKKGGRLIYVGSGTSGRLGALDASEIPPTFDMPASAVQYILAGGSRALGAATEASEDSVDLGRAEMAKKKPSRNDVVVGIAASGRTPFTIAALQYARSRGAKAIAVACNPRSPLGRAADISIVADVGPEVLTGSTRMKAGTAQKMILNMLSTGAMTRLGYVYGNLMVHVEMKNSKLIERGIAILQSATGKDRASAEQALRASRNRVPVALVMLETGASRVSASRALKLTFGNVRAAIATARRNSSKNSHSD